MKAFLVDVELIGNMNIVLQGAELRTMVALRSFYANDPLQYITRSRLFAY